MILDAVSRRRRECWVYPSGVEGDDCLWFSAKHDGGRLRKDGGTVGTRARHESRSGTLFTAPIMVNGRYIKAYRNQQRRARPADQVTGQQRGRCTRADAEADRALGG